MGRRGDGTGARITSVGTSRELGEREINEQLVAAGITGAEISWRDFPVTASGVDREFVGLEFLPRAQLGAVRADWANHWPVRGRAQTWDAVGVAGDVVAGRGEGKLPRVLYAAHRSYRAEQDADRAHAEPGQALSRAS